MECTVQQCRAETRGARAGALSAAASAIILSIYSGCLALIGCVLFRDYGFPLDDSYIHQTIARNFAHSKVLGLLANRPSSGSTSVLWTVFQSMNYGLFHLDPILFNLFVSWILLMGVGFMLFRLAVRYGLPFSASLIFALAPAFCGNFVWLAMIGMEHLLFVLLVLAAVYAWFEQERFAFAVFAGVCTGLASLTRPEAIVLGPVLASAGWLMKRPIAHIRTLLVLWHRFLLCRSQSISISATHFFLRQ